MAGKLAAASPENSEDAKGGLWIWLGRLRNDYSNKKHRVVLKWKQVVGTLRLLYDSEIPILYHFMQNIAPTYFQKDSQDLG